jgi:hypothetical protein
MEPTPPPAPSQPRSNWWGRNWKWFVPTGCLSLLLLFFGFIALVALAVFGTMKSSAAYKDALAKAKSDPTVIEALGTPIKEGMWVSGKSEVNGASGETNLAVPISGPRGKGTLYVVATKSAGIWSYTTLAVQIEKTGERINLLEKTIPQHSNSP